MQPGARPASSSRSPSRFRAPQIDRVDRVLAVLVEFVERLPKQERAWLDGLDRADRLLLRDALADARQALDRFEALLR